MADGPGSPADGSQSGGERSPQSNYNIREQDRFLPIANISRIMKKALPTNGKIAKDAKDTVQECVSEFISFITSEASDKCQKEKRKTINGDDLLWAMATLGFEDYIDPLKAYLSRYREGDSKGSARGGDGSGKKDTIDTQLAPNAQDLLVFYLLLFTLLAVYSSRFLYTRHELREFPSLKYTGSFSSSLADILDTSTGSIYFIK
ncbi:nuclear transcription factor Y subunit B-1-like protein [Tanacetum coccineum]|uniref:Nuclear transcription factor Y subunit B-1-like protein n=1 Tax=Tanacetum coccineum TaxID=301880 RepID=A0ABQ4X765_9ASTR